MNLLEKIKRKLFNFYNSNLPLSPPGAEEIFLIEQLRKRMEELLPSSQVNVNSFWSEQRKRLIDEVLNSDPRNFLRWNEIANTMFNGGDIDQIKTLKKSPFWEILSKAIVENNIGNPIRFYAYPTSSGNLIHHAYSLNELLTKSNISVNTVNNIFEFGGGYGSFCRLFINMGFKKTYTIFDLPEFNFIQEFYLKNLELVSNYKLNVKVNSASDNSINLLSDVNSIKSNRSLFDKVELFIALWSLSESPVSLRDQIFELLPDVKIYFIGFQKKFNGIDNERYFHEVKSRLRNFNWIEYNFPYMADNKYLIGIRKT